MQESKGNSQGRMSKKRYQELAQKYSEVYSKDQAENIMRILREVLNYSPDHSTYSETTLEYVRRYRKKLKAASESA